MRKIYVFVLAFFSALPLFAQNTTIELNSLTGNNIFCRSGADTVVLSITGSNIPAGSDVILYSSTDSTFNPYLGQGDSIGYFKGDSIQSDLLPSRSCVDIIGIFIDACNPSPIPEYHNEYIFLNSGQGLRVDSLKIDWPNNSGTGNSDVNLGSTPCGIIKPSTTLMNTLRTGSCNTTNFVAVGPGDSIPPNVIVLFFASNSVDYPYNFSNLCAGGVPIYVTQNACTRTNGAFVNDEGSNGCTTSRYRTTTVYYRNCVSQLTYDRCGLPNKDGSYAVKINSDTASVANGGIKNNAVNYCDGISIDSIKLNRYLFELPLTDAYCNTGTNYIKAIIRPLGNISPAPVSNVIKYQLVCNDVTATPANINICSGENAQIAISSNDPNAVLSWTVSGGANISGAASGTGNNINQLLTYTGETKDSVIYTVRSTDAGCVETQTVKVVVNNCKTVCEAAVAIAGNTTICGNNATILTAVGHFDSVRWSNNATTQSVSVNQSATYSVTAYKNGCSAAASVTVNSISCEPEDTTICEGGSVVLNAPNGYTSYQWSPATGLNNAGIQNPVASPADTTTYQLIAKKDTVSKINLVFNGDFELGNAGFTTDLNNIPFFGATPNSVYNIDTIVNANDPQQLWCRSGDHTASGSNMMIVDGPATANSNETIWQQTIQIAANTAYRFEAYVMNNHPQVPPVFDVFINGTNVVNDFTSATTCQWNLMSGTWNAGAATTATIRIVDNTGVNFGNDFLLDDIALFMIDTVVYQKTVTVNVNPLPEPAITGPTNFCAGTAVTLTVSGEFDSVRWNTGANTSSIEVNQPNNYSVTAYRNGCSATASQQVVQNNPPAAFSLGRDTAYCGSFTRILSTGNASTVWNTEQTGAQITVNEAGIYTATISNQCGSETAQIEIVQNEIPAINLGNDTAFCETNITLSVPEELSAVWNTGAQDNSIVVTEEGTYIVTVTNESGCQNSDTIIVSTNCKNDIWLPNAFTPNGDGVNDIFYVRGNPKNAEIEKMYIYSRWGNKVFEAENILPDDPSTGWNGQYKDQSAQVEVYGYQVVVRFKDGSRKTLKGNVTLLK